MFILKIAGKLIHLKKSIKRLEKNVQSVSVLSKFTEEVEKFKLKIK